MAVSVETLGELSEIVEQKKWEFFDGFYRKNKSIYGSLLEMFSGLDQCQSSLLLNMIREYLIIPDYKGASFAIIDTIISNGISEAAFCPVKLRKHTKTKSGQSLLYDIDSVFSQYDGCNFETFDDPTRDAFLYDTRTKILVDDFIGTGDQLTDVLKEIEKADPSLRFDLLVTIAMQTDARKYIEVDLGIPVLTLNERGKGIAVVSKKYSQPIADCYSVYDQIAAIASLSPLVALGYGEAEALITMKRTPDNTLPIFWEVGNKNWPAPFPR